MTDDAIYPLTEHSLDKSHDPARGEFELSWTKESSINEARMASSLSNTLHQIRLLRQLLRC